MQGYNGRLATMADARAMGVRSLDVWCAACGRDVTIPGEALPGSAVIRHLRRRLRCSGCGARPADVRPCWKEYQPPGLGRRFVGE